MTGIAHEANEALAPLIELFPSVEGEAAPYWEGLAAGELRLQRCSACGAYRFPAESFCERCAGTELEWETVPGHGTVYSFIVVHQLYHPAFAKLLPYTVAVVDLDEGVRMLGTVLGEDGIAIGDRVRARIERLDDAHAALFFERSDEAAGG
jgi:uncharacterized OB-fold protein